MSELCSAMLCLRKEDLESTLGHGYSAVLCDIFILQFGVLGFAVGNVVFVK